MNRRQPRKWLSLFLLLVMVLTTLPAVAAQASQQSLDKIEPALLDRFSTEGTSDFLVRFAEQADLSPAQSMNWNDRGWFVYNTLRAVADRSQTVAQAYLKAQGAQYQSYFTGNEIYVWGGNMAMANALAALPEVAAIFMPRTYYLDPPMLGGTAVTPDAFDWGIPDTKAEQFWAAFGAQGDGIISAGIDTGVDWTHDALQPEYKCLSNPSDPACWLDPAPANCTGPSGGPCDSWSPYFHGTHTMGTQVGDDNPALQYQVGMAPNSRWIACMGCPGGSCPTADLNACADWLVAPGGDPANRPHVVNNSWGGGGGNTFYLAKVQAWRAAGIFPAFSAGNSGSGCSTLGSPGDYQESFGSAAHDSSRNIASFSSRGPSSAFGHTPYTKPNISAPGVNVMSAKPGDTWQLMSGTSMASPHTAGAVALLWSCNPSLIGQIDQTFQILQDNADVPPAGNCGAPPDNEGNYTYGYGYLNVYAAGLLNCGETGWLDGHVTDAVTGDPIAGATVSTGAGQGTTDGSGYYTMTLSVGTYDATASHPQYIADTATGLVIVTDTVTTQDFALEPRGHLFGYVTDYDNGFPMDAMVTADDGQAVNTDPATGYYEVYLDPGSHVVTATATDYAPDLATVVMVSGEDTQQDFALQAAVAFMPSPLHVTLNWLDTYNMPATLTNRLLSGYAFELQEKPGGYVPFIEGQPPAGPASPASDAGLNPEQSSTGRAPTAPQYDPSGGGWPFAGILAAPAYGHDVYPSMSFLYWPDLAVPGTATTIVGGEPSFFTGGDFINGDFSTQYAIMYGTNQFYRIDTTTGARTLIATPSPAGSWTGMTASPDGTLYVSASSCGSSSTLYIINPTTGALTTIGNVTNAPCLIDMAYDPNSPYIYGVDIVSDVLVRIDPATAAGTVVGSVGVNANYAQSMDFDDESGILYWAAYSSQGELRTINISTGASTLIGAFPSGGEIDAFSVPTGGQQDVPWLGENPVAGTVPAQSSINPTMYFTATPAVGVTQPGDYWCDLRVKGTPQLTVRVTMTVLPADDMGQLHGYVLDNCTGEPVEATISIAGGVPITETTSNKDTGYYSAWLVEGTYDIVVSAPGYVNYPATVDIVAGQDVVLDVSLVPDRACIGVDPAAFEVWVLPNTQAVRLMNVENRGGQPLNFVIHEFSGTATLLDVIIPARPATAPAGTAAASHSTPAPERTYAVPTYARPDSPPNVLLLNADDDNDMGSPILDMLNAFGDLGAIDMYDARYGTPTLGELQAYDVVVVWANYVFADAAGMGNVLADYVDAGGRVIDLNFAIDSSWGMQGRFVTENYTAITHGSTSYTSACLGSFNPGHPVMSDPTPITNVCEPYYRIDSTSVTPGSTDVAWWDDGAVLVGVKDNRSVVTINGYVGFYYDWSGQMDALLHNAILWVSVPPYTDVPWLEESPITVTVAPLSNMNDTITFTALPTMSLGTYTATLVIENNDSVVGAVNVPAIMHIVDQFITPTAGFDSNSPVCLGEEAVFINTTIPGVPPTTDYLWDLGDGITSTLENPVHVYTAAGIYDVSLLACNEAGCDTYVAQFEVIPPPTASFIYTVVDLTVSFTSTSVGADTYLWNLGDGFTSTLQNPVHTYAAGGLYTVTLAVEGPCGAGLYSEVIEVGVPPVAGFEDNSPVCLGVEMVFTNTTTGTSPITYLWDFGDGTTSTLENPTHLYTAAGLYDVVLEATNGYGVSTVTQTVEVQPLPAASFTYVSGGLVVTFTNTSQNALAYLWDFGDGSTSTETNPIHTYATVGTYTVILTAYGPCGEDSYQTDVVISLLPVAGFTSNSPVCLGEEMVFTNTSAGAPPLTFLWDFGDGATSTLRNPVHTYAAAGTYTVVLTATNASGSDTVSQDVVVQPLPVAAFTVDADGLTITFTNGSQNADTYLWDFGDGTTSTEVSPVHVYGAEGTYTATLTAYGPCGEDTELLVLQVTICDQVEIVTVTTAIAECEVTFTPQVAGEGPFDYGWDFGAFGTSTETNPVVDFGATGMYPVTLQVWNCGGIGHAVLDFEVEVQCAGVYTVYLPVVYKNAQP